MGLLTDSPAFHRPSRDFRSSAPSLEDSSEPLAPLLPFLELLATTSSPHSPLMLPLVLLAQSLALHLELPVSLSESPLALLALPLEPFPSVPSLVPSEPPLESLESLSASHRAPSVLLLVLQASLSASHLEL